MITIFSPAKTFRKIPLKNLEPTSNLIFPQETNVLINLLQQYSKNELASLMNLSDELAASNYERYQNFEKQTPLSAMYAFEGEAYKGLDAATLSETDIIAAQKTVFILCGLFGMLSPTTLIKPYRLEMAQQFKDNEIKNLYQFWRPVLTKKMLEMLDETEGDKVLVNLASNEYSKALHLKEIEKTYSVVTIEFKDKKNDTYKAISMYAKKARGQMVRYIIENKIHKIECIKQIELDGYQYNDTLSTKNKWIFTR